MNVTIRPILPSMPSGVNDDVAAPGRFGNGRTITAGAGAGGATPASIRQAIVGGQSASVQVALKSVRDALGLGEAVTVDKATEADVTREGPIGDLFRKAFTWPPPPYAGEGLKS